MVHHVTSRVEKVNDTHFCIYTELLWMFQSFDNIQGKIIQMSNWLKVVTVLKRHNLNVLIYSNKLQRNPFVCNVFPEDSRMAATWTIYIVHEDISFLNINLQLRWVCLMVTNTAYSFGVNSLQLVTKSLCTKFFSLAAVVVVTWN